MTGPIVAKLWWEAPHVGLSERLMSVDDVLTFGRGSECTIRIGHAPVYEPQVPRLWGEISHFRGAVHVHNRSTRWGLLLVPAGDNKAAVQIQVPPGVGATSAASRFRIVAQAPGFEMALEVLSAPRAYHAETGQDDPPSFVPFSLTPTQQLIARAVIAPFQTGGSRRAGYADIARSTHYAERTVREAVAAMDGLFVLYRLVDPASNSDSLDRVAQAVRLHTTLLGPTERTR